MEVSIRCSMYSDCLSVSLSQQLKILSQFHWNQGKHLWCILCILLNITLIPSLIKQHNSCVPKENVKNSNNKILCVFLKGISTALDTASVEVVAYTMCTAHASIACQTHFNSDLPIYGFKLRSALQPNSLGRLVLFLLSKLIWCWQFVYAMANMTSKLGCIWKLVQV